MSHLHASDEPSLGNDVSFLLDLLSHDVLNNNQVVLSYLELLRSAPDAGRRTQEYAEKAASQLRAASMLIDGTKRLLAAVKDGPMPLEPVNVLEALEKSFDDLAKAFPHRRIEADLTAVDPRAEVLGGVYVQDLLDNLLTNAAQLDAGQVMRVGVTLRASARDGTAYQTIRMAAPTVTLPQGIDKDILSVRETLDVSKVVRVSGLVVAGRIAMLLGGSLRCEQIGPKDSQGCAFEATLKGADGA